MVFPMRHRGSVSSLGRTCRAVARFIAARPPAPLALAFLSTGFIIVATAVGAQVASAGEGKSAQALPYAFAKRGCTQEDAPALEIYLTQTKFGGVGDPSPPYLHIEISSSPTEAIGPISLDLVPLRRDPTKPGRIARANLMERGRAPTWLSGTIALDAVAPGQPLFGRYDFVTPAGKRLNGNFRAEYSNRAPTCG
jgi:hypothetical protein